MTSARILMTSAHILDRARNLCIIMRSKKNIEIEVTVFLGRFIDWSVWSVDRLNGWSIDRLVDWLIDRLIDWSVDRWIDWSIGRLLPPPLYNRLQQQVWFGFNVIYSQVYSTTNPGHHPANTSLKPTPIFRPAVRIPPRSRSKLTTLR